MVRRRDEGVAPGGRGRDGDSLSSPRVFTIPASEPFLERLAEAILAGHLPQPHGAAPDPMELPDFTILLPTRRAARALHTALLKASGKEALLLPRIRPIAETQDDVGLLVGLAAQPRSFAGPPVADVAPAIGELERRLVLTRLVRAWSAAVRRVEEAGEGGVGTVRGAGAGTPAQAAHLAADLARLMDLLETERVGLDGLADLVPEIHAAHWQETIGFLSILGAHWPSYLAQSGRLSPAARTNTLLEAEVQRLTSSPPGKPIIIAGVTGSVPATAALMATVARLEKGAVVLPGFGQAMSSEAWQGLREGAPEHPQAGLARVLEGIGVTPDEVVLVPGAEPSASGRARLGLLSQTMRPAAETGAWYAYASAADPDEVEAALGGLSLVVAPTAQDEAEVAALILRHAAETPGRTAALVSPDRMLARRVQARLETWGIRVDDSAGRPLRKTVAGALLDLVVDAVASDFEPAKTMSLLKHPLTRLGLDVATARKAARALEIAAFRTIYLGGGVAGIEAALEEAAQAEADGRRRELALKRLSADNWEAARELVRRLREAVEPLTRLFASPGPHPLGELAAAHVAVAEAMVRRPVEDAGDGAAGERGVDSETGTGEDDSKDSPIWHGEAGAAASLFFTGLMDADLSGLDLPAADYPDLYRTLVADVTVRPRVPVHPRLFIWGPFEARLQHADVLVLGGLNEGTWPEVADPGPWLNRGMRKELGLPAPEEDVGRAAHDFVSLAAAPRVIMTRAEKVDGVPTVPSRWLLRLGALLDGIGAPHNDHRSFEKWLAPDKPWLAWARARDRCLPQPTLSRPAPKPPVESRPRRMSVTAVETWIANPYAIFARSILRLEPLPLLGQAPDAALRGQIVHGALGRFAQRYPDTLPDDVRAQLMDVAVELFAQWRAHPRVEAFWLPRLERFARWFADTEPDRRQGVGKVLAELSGSLTLDAPTGPFVLTARADRFDVLANGVIITDYKTGTPPTNPQVNTGVSPQLPLEAAIMAAGGYEGVAASSVVGLRYIRASGGEPAGEQSDVKPETDVAALAERSVEGLARLVARFDDPDTPYEAVRRSQFSYRFDDYAHLARVKEWSGGDGDDEGEAGI